MCEVKKENRDINLILVEKLLVKMFKTNILLKYILWILNKYKYKRFIVV